jgi:hypothetical protein
MFGRAVGIEIASLNSKSHRMKALSARQTPGPLALLFPRPTTSDPAGGVEETPQILHERAHLPAHLQVRSLGLLGSGQLCRLLETKFEK